MSEVFVVLGESGEYSDRTVWVSGVYSTREAAEAVVTEKSAARRMWEQWHSVYERGDIAATQAEYQQRRLVVNDELTCITLPPNYEAVRARARAFAGPEPAYEPGERFQIFPTRLDVWETPKPLKIERIIA